MTQSKRTVLSGLWNTAKVGRRKGSRLGVLNFLMENRRYIIFYQPPNAVGTLPEASFLLRCDFFSLTICMLLGRLFGKRKAFQMNPWLKAF